MSQENKATLDALPQVTILGNNLDKLYDIKFYKGKFVVYEGKFIAKVFPEGEYDGSKFFHSNILEELGVKSAGSASVKKLLSGGGKIEVELIDDYLECRLRGSSHDYGSYDPADIDSAILETALDATFHIGMMPVLVIADMEEMMATE